MERQYGAATGYAGITIISDIFAKKSIRREREYRNSFAYQRLSEAQKENRDFFNEEVRKISFYNQLSDASRSMSAYHSFQTSVKINQKYGLFNFIKHQDTPEQIAWAPFEFHYLTKPRTYLPLAFIASLAAAGMAWNLEDEENEKRTLTNSDYYFSAASSYLAGTHEEALFRGWIQPSLRESTGSDFWSNAITSLIFARSHYPKIEVPIPQLILGWHFGYIVQESGYSLREAVFLHTWWDVFAFLGTYQYQRRNPNAVIPPLWLPALTLSF